MKFRKLSICANLVALFAVAQLQAKTQLNELQKSSSNNKMIEFKFKEHLIRIPVSSNKDISKLIGVEPVSGDTQLLKISTPQFKAQLISKIPVQLVSNFNALETIKSDIQSLGYNAVKIESEKMTSGLLYYWQTPTKGSASYFYFQNPKEKMVALKVGPLPDSVRIDFHIDWSKSTWADLSSDR